jgi:2-hydroxychromene-2-carboxylate isomerase
LQPSLHEIEPVLAPEQFAVDLHHGTQAAMNIAGAILRAVWAQERNIADPQVLEQLLAENGLQPQRLEQSRGGEVQERYAANTQQAADLGVFGAPTYAIDGELFWGQDRLDFVQRRLQS